MRAKRIGNLAAAPTGDAILLPGERVELSRGTDAETRRLAEDERREKNWKRWGPYLAERQWGTVREDYSADGACWDYLPHDHARSRAYRWGEDGLLGICDREGRLCFAFALWNERDPILKERLFGLAGPEGNHGEDVKEAYFYLDATPTHSYMKALYKYPQAEFPYARLVGENRRRGRDAPEFELADTGVLDGGRYFDVFAEYAKATPDDLLIRLTVFNRGPDAAPLHLLPTLWFRNTWSWGRTGEGYWQKPRIARVDEGARKGTGAHARRSASAEILAEHETLGRYRLAIEGAPQLLFTENETNNARLFGHASAAAFVKDGFHEYLVGRRASAVNPAGVGTKVAAHFRHVIPAGGAVTVRLRLTADSERTDAPFGPEFDETFAARAADADAFYAVRLPPALSEEERRVARQAYAGLLWSKQFFHYVVKDWIEGDPAQPPPPPSRSRGRNAEWRHLFNRDVVSMPDKWEYPWYAAWDLAFHMVPFARVDPHFAKEQLVLFLREWYMHPNGQLPAYEFAFSDVNPPVHAWAAWRVYKMTGARGERDRRFLARVFQKLLINFTWWVNRKDAEGKNLFSGGFLGLDNIGVFDRSRPLPTGGHLEQADGTAWMAFYCATMLSIALELASENPVYEDVASKFFEHFVAIVDAMNTLGGTGLWDEQDGFYYDQLHVDGVTMPLRIRSMVGLVPLFTAEILEAETIARLPGFSKRMRWFLKNRKDIARHITYMEVEGGAGPGGDASGSGSQKHRLLAVPSRERLERMLRYLLDENEFLSPFGIRSLSRVHGERPYALRVDGQEYRVAYEPGESTSGIFGGNSNWRGPVWFPMNYLLVEALERYHLFYGDSLRVECPTGSGRMMTLADAAREIDRRLARLFMPDARGVRPASADFARFASGVGGVGGAGAAIGAGGSGGAGADWPNWRDLVLFHEHFHGDNGRGLGASHQTGWTALVVRCLENLSRR